MERLKEFILELIFGAGSISIATLKLLIHVSFMHWLSKTFAVRNTFSFWRFNMGDIERSLWLCNIVIV